MILRMNSSKVQICLWQLNPRSIVIIVKEKSRLLNKFSTEILNNQYDDNIWEGGSPVAAKRKITRCHLSSSNFIGPLFYLKKHANTQRGMHVYINKHLHIYRCRIFLRVLATSAMSDSTTLWTINCWAPQSTDSPGEVTGMPFSNIHIQAAYLHETLI